MTDPIDRRRFLKVLGVTGAGAAAVSACGIGPEPTERLIPYLVQPEDQIPGTATYYATTCRECAAGCGVRVRVREGRAVKLEGNPDSPINRGRLCARGQAALQGLYNPDRISHPLVRNAGGTFEAIDWDGALQRLSAKVREAQGKGIVFLTGAEQSSFGDLVDEAGGWPAHELRGLRVRGATCRQSPRVWHGDPAELRLRECEVRVVVRCRLPRHLALAGRIPERIRERACVRCGPSRVDGEVRVRRPAPVAHRHERRRVDR